MRMIGLVLILLLSFSVADAKRHKRQRQRPQPPEPFSAEWLQLYECWVKGTICPPPTIPRCIGPGVPIPPLPGEESRRPANITCKP